MAAEVIPDQRVIETTGNTRKLEIKWIFRNAALEWSSKQPGDVLESPRNHAKGDKKVQWVIEIHPNGDYEENKGYVSVYLCLKSSTPDRQAIPGKCWCTFYDEESKEYVGAAQTTNHVFDLNHQYAWGWPQFVLQSDILKSNVFSLIYKLEYEDSKTTTSAFLSTSSSQSLLKNDEAISNLSQDLEQLFINRSGTDICFVVDGKEIKAHKLLLSARSPVFAAMLESGMKETVENRVKIDDIAPDIFEALLRSIYTDRVDLTKIDPKDLLAAANKYLLSLLKIQCQRFLASKLSTINCVELLALADLHNAMHLKKSAVNFIRLHITDIMQTEGWKDLKRSHPGLVLDTIESFL